MALWGTADSLYSVGTVTVDYGAKTITGSGSSFTASGISTGTVITIGAGGTFGQAVIAGITSDTLISIATTQYLNGAPIAGVAYTLSQRPVYVLEDSNYSLTQTTSTNLTNAVYGVDIYEQSANTATGSLYQAQHAGWVGVHTYIDMHGNLRVKSETLVAMSGISTGADATYGGAGDAGDDATFADRFITITVQPQSQSVGVGTTATFSVTAIGTPDAGTPSYQWQKSTTAGGSTYANIGGATSSSVSVANTNTANNGYLYRVVVSSTGGAADATSSSATLTVS